jgi:uncharacterized protein
VTIKGPLRASGIALAVALSGCGAEKAKDLPVGPVADQADILPAAVEASLDERLTAYWKNSGNAVVVASVKSLDGKPIEEVARETFNRWGIGDKKTNRGLLLLVAPNERMVRIEVGCGLESVITNDAAAEVIENNILPHFQEGDLSTGTLTGANILVARLDAGQNPGPVSEYCRKLMKQTI